MSPTSAPLPPPFRPRRQRIVPTLEGNRFLALLPDADREALLAAATPLRLSIGEVLHQPGQVMERVVFPESGLISLLACPSRGEWAEVAVIGPEGMVGLPAALVPGIAAQMQSVVQIQGQAQSVPAHLVRERLAASTGMRDRVDRFVLALTMSIGQVTACNALHRVDARLARWLLNVGDRVGPGFPMTQAFLGVMLGASRVTVNGALGRMADAGYVRLSRGRIVVADEAGLESLSCPCHGQMRRAFETLLPGALRGNPVSPALISGSLTGS